MNLNIPIEQYLKRFKVINPVTLFEPTKDDMVNALLQKRCPLCGTKLYQSRDGKKWFCKSMRRDKYFIRDEVLRKYF